MTEVRDLLFELGVEELPPAILATLAESLLTALQKHLHAAKLSFGDGKCFATPRRLAVWLQNVAVQQVDSVVEQKGPNVKVAFSATGIPSEACLGFARSCGVEVEQLERKIFGKEERVVCTVTQRGMATQQLLPDLLAKAIKELPIPKKMRWGQGDFEFIRPVHWVVLLFGTEVVPAVMLGKTASNQTFGHRFHHPEAITITEPKQYEQLLETIGCVIPDFAKRKQLIWDKVTAIAADVGIPLANDVLLQEVASLVEWPVALLGKFDARFLHLPQEVLILVMEKQQRYFALLDEDNKLAPYFVCISNIVSKNPEAVSMGNANVIRARFTDAEFFYNLDTKYVLDGYIEKLQHAVFQADLGTVYDKVLRITDLAAFMARKLDVPSASVKRAAELSKFDLMTAMVGEFPELQGIMGYYYALHYGETDEVAHAIMEQYLPKGTKDELPQTIAGALLALADRIDMLVGIFSLKKLPTGDKDPFGLRRAVFGILRISIEKNLDLDLHELLTASMQFYRNLLEKYDAVILKNYQVPSQDNSEDVNAITQRILTQIFNFVYERLRTWYAERNVTAHVFNAVLAKRPTRILDFARRIDAVAHFLTLPEAEALSMAHKRVNNILQKSVAAEHVGEVQVKLLKEPAEQELQLQIAQKHQAITDLYQKGNYKEIMTELAALKPAVDNFFDSVMVNVDDKKLRNNRMALLQQLQNMFMLVADIAEL